MFSGKYQVDARSRKELSRFARVRNRTAGFKWTADRDFIDQHGQSDLHRGVSRYCVDDKLFASAIRVGCDVNRADKKGQTALHMAAKKGLSNCVRTLIDRGAKADLLDGNEMTPLMYASEHGHLPVIECLVKNGANVNLSNKKGQLALHYSCTKGHSKCTEYLLKHKAKPNYPDNEGTTPLILACQSHNGQLVQLLLDAGAKPDKLDKMKRSALHWATLSGNEDAVNALIRASASLDLLDKDFATPFIYAICNNFFAILHSLVSAGCDRTCMDGMSGTALTLTALKGHNACVKVLLSAGENPDEFSYFGMTALMASVYESHYEVTETILQYKPNINIVSRLGFTALFASLCHITEANALTRHKLLVLLLQHGADVNYVASSITAFGTIMTEKSSPTLFAVSTGYVSLVKILLYAGSQVTHDELEYLIKRYHLHNVFECSSILKPIVDYKCTPLPLQHICRIAIRNNLGTKAYILLQELPIPAELKHYLNFSDLAGLQPERADFRCPVDDLVVSMLDLSSCGLKAINGSFLFEQVGKSVLQAAQPGPCYCDICLRAQMLQQRE